MTETLRTVAETAVCRTCDFQVTAITAESRYKELATLRGLLFRLHYWGGAMLFALVWLQLVIHSSCLLCG